MINKFSVGLLFLESKKVCHGKPDYDLLLFLLNDGKTTTNKLG